jgi:predicted ATP-grasp superfamily ATP-dependent carboligase
MTLSRILILDGHSSAALAFVRSLGRAGHWVAVAAVSGSFAAATESRYCKVSLSYSNPLQGVESFIETIRSLILEYSIELVVPITDATVWPLSQAEELQKLVKIAAPGKEAVELVSDKYRTVTLAASLGVPVPKTMLVQSVDDKLESVDTWGYPIVVKDRFSINWKNGKGVSGGVQFAYNIGELHSIVNSRLGMVNEVLLQNFSPGEGIGFSCFSSGGEIYLPFEWRRLREKDPRGSGSSARMSVRLDADIVKHSSALILEADFQGIAMVEYKRNRKNGALTLMEINGRPWGSMQLPIHAGVDYPSLLVEWIINGTLPPKLLEYLDNITCRWLTADFVHLENLWGGQPPGWPEAYPNFWVNVFKVLLPWYPGLRYDHLSFDDPGPGVADLKKWFNNRFGNKSK